MFSSFERGKITFGPGGRSFIPYKIYVLFTYSPPHPWFFESKLTFSARTHGFFCFACSKSWILQLIDALDRLYSIGIILRDSRASNLLFSDGGRRLAVCDLEGRWGEISAGGRLSVRSGRLRVVSQIRQIRRWKLYEKHGLPKQSNHAFCRMACSISAPGHRRSMTASEAGGASKPGRFACHGAGDPDARWHAE